MLLHLSSDHNTHPELWFRPVPQMSGRGIVALINCGTLIATPRLGKRDESHEKGFAPGQQVTLRVFDHQDAEHWRKKVRIVGLRIKLLSGLTLDDLHGTLYHHWEEVQSDLSYFERRLVAPNEHTTIVRFAI